MIKLIMVLTLSSLFLFAELDQLSQQFMQDYQENFYKNLKVDQTEELLVLGITENNHTEYRSVYKNNEMFALEMRPFDKEKKGKELYAFKSGGVDPNCRIEVQKEFFTLVKYFKEFTYADKAVYQKYSSTLGYEQFLEFGESNNLKGFVYINDKLPRGIKPPKRPIDKSIKNIRLYIPKTYSLDYSQPTINLSFVTKFTGKRIGLFKYDTKIDDNWDKIIAKNMTVKKISNLKNPLGDSYSFNYTIVDHSQSRMVFLQYNFIQDEENMKEKLEFHNKQSELILSKNLLKKLGNIGKHNSSDSGFIDFSIDKFPMKKSNFDMIKFTSTFTRLFSKQNFAEERQPVTKIIYERVKPTESRFMQPTLSRLNKVIVEPAINVNPVNVKKPVPIKIETNSKPTINKPSTNIKAGNPKSIITNPKTIQKSIISKPTVIKSAITKINQPAKPIINKVTKPLVPKIVQPPVQATTATNIVKKEVINFTSFIKVIRSICQRLTDEIFSWDYLGKRNTSADITGVSSNFIAFDKGSVRNYVYVYNSVVGFGTEDIIGAANKAFADNGVTGFETKYTCQYHNDRYYTSIELNELYLITFAVNRSTVEAVSNGQNRNEKDQLRQI